MKKMKKHGCQMNLIRRISLESYPTVHLGGGPMTVSESYPAIHLGGLSNRILLENGIMFSRIKTFCFENSVFSHLA